MNDEKTDKIIRDLLVMAGALQALATSSNIVFRGVPVVPLRTTDVGNLARLLELAATALSEKERK